jgi:hypothetical protein
VPVTKFPLPLKTLLPTTFTAYCALMESPLLSSSRLNLALLLAANLYPSPTLATLPIKQAEFALAAVTLSSLLNSDRNMVSKPFCENDETTRDIKAGDNEVDECAWVPGDLWSVLG